MIFNLPPILGLAPLLLYIVLSFVKDMHPITNIFLCTVLGAVMTGFNLLDFGSLIYDSMGSSLAFVSFIVMSATGLSAIMKKTGVAEMMVHFIMEKIGVNTKTRAILAIMVSSTVLATLLGTWAGANAVIAPIAIPMVTALAFSHSTLTVIFFGAGEIGMFLSPLAPPAVVVMELTGISFPTYALTTGLPLGTVIFLCTFFCARIVQKKTEGTDLYDPDDFEMHENYTASAATKRAAAVFFVTLFAGIAVAIIRQSGMKFTLEIIWACIITTGLAYGLQVNDIVDGLLEGRKMWHTFVILILFNPFINFVMESGAFDAVSALLSPLMANAGKPVFSVLSAFIGIFGINGAHVAQSPLIDSLFGTMASGLGLSPALWAFCLTIGTQVTSYAYPGVDTVNQMAISRATPSISIKWLMFLSYVFVIPATLILTFIMSFII